ncbi:extracellular solute-binding protein [Mycetocola sp. 2940]|uniref:ABC transporter substrate-binding protein n=1 Tax=Mycetocola sp. 2940 TaxID=3156452 RepID=UPI00339635A5
MKLSRNKYMTGVALTSAAALLLVGCSTAPASEPKSEGEGDTAGSNLLTISWKGSEKAGIDAVVALFKEANPEAEVVVSIADTEQYQATLRTQLAAGSAADVMYLWPANGNPGALRQIAPGGFLTDLSDREWAGNYPESIEEQLSVDGKVYIMGTLVNTFGGFYNQATLDETGLSAPTIWPEVLPFCEAAKSQGKVAYSIGGATLNNVQNVVYSLAPTLVYGENPDFDEQIEAGDTSFSEEPGYQKAFEYFQQMIDAGCFNPDSTGVNNDGMLQMVADGSALGTMPSALQMAALRVIAGDDPISYVPLSGGDDPDTGIIAAASSGGAAVNKNAKNPDMSLDFVDFLASTEGTQAYVNAMQGPVPAIANPDIELSPTALTTISDYLEEERTVHFLNQYWPNARVEQAMFAGLQGMLTGDTSAEEALKSMDDEYAQG